MQVCPPAPSLSVCGVQGVLRMNQEVEVRPGIITKDAEGRVKCIPVFSRVVSLFAEQVGSRAWLGGWDGMECKTRSFLGTGVAHSPSVQARLVVAALQAVHAQAL